VSRQIHLTQVKTQYSYFIETVYQVHSLVSSDRINQFITVVKFIIQ